MNAPPAPARLHTLAFNDPQAGIWGVMLGGDSPQDAALVVAGDGRGDGAGELSVTVSVEDFPAAGPWRLQGEGAELSAAPQVDEIAGDDSRDAQPVPEAWAQSCRVHGRIRLDEEEEISVSGEGVRATHPSLGRSFDSARAVCAWTGHGEGMAVAAVRPGGAKGHDRDRILGCSLETTGSRSAAEPRLSTTYAADGTPARAGVELWLTGDDGESEYPRRGSGITVGQPLTLWGGGLRAFCHLLRWSSRGEVGAGMFLLIHPLPADAKRPIGRRIRP